MDPGSALAAHLADVSLRSLGLAAAAWAAIRLLRVRGAAGRHAIWTLTTAAMLLMAVLHPLLPPLTLRVLRPAPAAPVPAVAPVASVALVASVSPAAAPAVDASLPVERAPAIQPAPRRAPISWRQAVAAVYGAGVLLFAALLGASYAFTRRLVRASRPVDGLGTDGVFESDWIAVPMTVGLARPRILLPAGWREWPAEKLAAAMAHERMHVRRADWAIAVLAGLNWCLFWFHPLAWWLRRRLAALAEQACDDATVLELGRRECYAQTLLEMTAAVKSGRGRLVWEAMAMARTAEVRNRIERILDETREIPRGWSPARWLAVAACSLPLFYMTAAVRVTRAQEATPAPAAASQPQPVEAQPQSKPDAAPQPAASPRPQRPSRIDIPGADMERRLVRKVEPEYPPKAIEAGTQGEVILETVIGADGHVKSARPIFGSPMLAAAAQAAVLQYVYRTPPGSGEPGTEIASTATVIFRLPVGVAHPPGFQDPILIYKREPEYTEEARRAKVNGEVELEFLVGEDGVPRDVRVVKSLPLLDDAAVEALSHWRFKPASLNGVPVEKKTKATITFKLFPGMAGPVPPAGSTEPEQPRQAQGAGADTTVLRSSGSDTASQAPANRIAPARLVYKRDPEYPEAAREVGQSGIVELVATIGVDGRVKSVKVVKGPPMLQKAAQEAVMQWVYVPTMLDGVAVENEAHISISFSLPPAPPPAAPQGEPDPPREPQAATPANPPPGPATAAKPPANPVSPAKLVYKRDPNYPRIAQQMGQRGAIELVATIGVDGRIKNVRVLNGPPVLQKAAEEAVLQWVYIPAMMDGVPVENQTHITINFQPLPAGHAAKPQNQPDHPQEAQAAATEAVPVYQIPGPEPAGKFLIAQIDHAETEFMLDPAFPKGAHGIVELAVTVGADGHVREAYATRADDAALGNAAVEAIRHKVFKPTLVNGLPVEDHMHLVLKFERPSTDAGKLPGGAPTPAPPPGAISQAVLLHKVDPVFPKITRQEGARGTVELVATIGADGKVKDVKVVKAADPALSKAAVEAVRQWVYKPTILNGVAIESQTHISIGFCCAK